MSQIPFDPKLVQTPEQPATASRPSASWLQTLLIVAAIVAGFWFLGRGGRGDADDPRPSVNVAEQSEKITREFVVSVGENSRVTAAGIREGKINTIDAAIEDGKSRWDASHKAFIQAMGELDNANIPESITDENRSALADYLDQRGKGISRAAK